MLAACCSSAASGGLCIIKKVSRCSAVGEEIARSHSTTSNVSPKGSCRPKISDCSETEADALDLTVRNRNIAIQ